MESTIKSTSIDPENNFDSSNKCLDILIYVSFRRRGGILEKSAQELTLVLQDS